MPWRYAINLQYIRHLQNPTLFDFQGFFGNFGLQRADGGGLAGGMPCQ